MSFPEALVHGSLWIPASSVSLACEVKNMSRKPLVARAYKPQGKFPFGKSPVPQSFVSSEPLLMFV